MPFFTNEEPAGQHPIARKVEQELQGGGQDSLSRVSDTGKNWLMSSTIGAGYRQHYGLILSGERTDRGSDEVQPFGCGNFSLIERLGWPFYTLFVDLNDRNVYREVVFRIESRTTGNLAIHSFEIECSLAGQLKSDTSRQQKPVHSFINRMICYWEVWKASLRTAEVCALRCKSKP